MSGSRQTPALSPAQTAALQALGEGRLDRDSSGWAIAGSGHPHHTDATITALETRGLARVNQYAGCQGSAGITRAGRELLEDLRRMSS